MIDDMIVGDAVVHCYNWVRENWAIPEAEIASGGAPASTASCPPTTRRG